MTTILDTFIEISNSEEALNMIFENHMIISKKTLPTKTLAHNKLKMILKQNDKKSLLAKYKKVSGDVLIVLAKQIAEDALKKYNDSNDLLAFVTAKEHGAVVNLEKLCVAMLNFQSGINNNLDLIIKNHNEGCYIFEGIDELPAKEDLKTNANIEKEMDNIKKKMNEIQKQLELLINERNRLKLDNKEFSDENKNLKKEITRKTKEVEKKEVEKNNINKELIKIKNNLKLKDKEILRLKEEVKNKNKILQDAIILDEFVVPKEASQNTCIIHTSPLLMVDKIHYDVKFTQYNSVYKEIKTYLKKLKSEGIFKVGIQSNDINSFKLQEIIEIGKSENIKIYRLFFNTEKELSEKLITLK